MQQSIVWLAFGRFPLSTVAPDVCARFARVAGTNVAALSSAGGRLAAVAPRQRIATRDDDAEEVRQRLEEFERPLLDRLLP